MSGWAMLLALATMLAPPGAEAGLGVALAPREALCREARAIAELPPCTGERGCAAYERFAERFGAPGPAEAAPPVAEGPSKITFPDRRPFRPAPWPPPPPFPTAPCPAEPGIRR